MIKRTMSFLTAVVVKPGARWKNRVKVSLASIFRLMT